jgi:hypothetical protein
MRQYQPCRGKDNLADVSRLSVSERERLTLLIEECSEVSHIACKILRHGYASCNPADPNQESNIRSLHRELGDMMAVLRLMMLRLDISQNKIDGFRDLKLARISTYLHHNSLSEKELK